MEGKSKELAVEKEGEVGVTTRRKGKGNGRKKQRASSDVVPQCMQLYRGSLNARGLFDTGQKRPARPARAICACLICKP
jgi:hypothetical protein